MPPDSLAFALAYSFHSYSLVFKSTPKARPTPHREWPGVLRGGARGTPPKKTEEGEKRKVVFNKKVAFGGIQKDPGSPPPLGGKGGGSREIHQPIRPPLWGGGYRDQKEAAPQTDVGRTDPLEQEGPLPTGGGVVFGRRGGGPMGGPRMGHSGGDRLWGRGTSVPR